MIFVPTSELLPVIQHYHGQVARTVDPINIDRRQAYLIAGRNPPAVYSFPEPDGDDRVLRLPVLLPPWCGEVRIAIRALRTVEAGVLTLQLRDYDPILEEERALSAYLELSGELDTGSVPSAEVSWGQVSFAGLDGLMGQGHLSLVLEGVSNEYRQAWIWLESVHCAVHDVLVRCWPSASAIGG